MNILNLTIRYEGIEKSFSFKENFNLIHSYKNSVGKSTLLRLLFYSLGYNIPGTKKMNFHKSETLCEIKNKLGKISISRVKDIINLYINDEYTETYLLPTEEKNLHSLIWGTHNTAILSNLLGAIYMDQDKGWTLLNRGTVIGSISFKIEELIQGLSDRDVEDLKEKQKSLEAELKKYRQIQNILEYQEHLTKQKENILLPSYSLELENEIEMLNFEKRDLEKKLNALEDVQKDNVQFIKFIEKMKIVVQDKKSGIEIPVNKNTLLYVNDNTDYLITRQHMLKISLADINKKMTVLTEKLRKSQNLIDIQTQIEQFDNHISNLDIDPTRLEKIILQLNAQNKELKKNIKNKIIRNNSVVNSLHKNILYYAKKLGVDNVIDSRNDYIFTSDLKSLSGAVLHKIVFCFKMAYILELQKYLKIKLPIVLDSPSGREVDQKNIRETMNILLEDFSENQVIIASIYKYDNLKPLHLIEIKELLLEE